MFLRLMQYTRAQLHCSSGHLPSRPRCQLAAHRPNAIAWDDCSGVFMVTAYGEAVRAGRRSGKVRCDFLTTSCKQNSMLLAASGGRDPMRPLQALGAKAMDRFGTGGVRWRVAWFFTRQVDIRKDCCIDSVERCTADVAGRERILLYIYIYIHMHVYVYDSYIMYYTIISYNITYYFIRPARSWRTPWRWSRSWPTWATTGARSHIYTYIYIYIYMCIHIV